MNLDFGSGYNPKTGYLPCDFTSNPKLDFYCLDYKIYDKNLKIVKPNTFKNIFCRNVLHHIENLELIIAELFRVLECNGKLIVIEPNKDHYYQNFMFDSLWYRFVNNRTDIWFSKNYRDYITILNKLFSTIDYNLENEKEFVNCKKGVC